MTLLFTSWSVSIHTVSVDKILGEARGLLASFIVLIFNTFLGFIITTITITMLYCKLHSLHIVGLISPELKPLFIGDLLPTISFLIAIFIAIKIDKNIEKNSLVKV